MKENAIKFLYAIDCYLLYLLSGVVAAALVVIFYSVAAVFDFRTTDSVEFINYVADFVSGKSSVVLVVSYCIIFIVLFLVFAIKRRSLSAYTGMSYARVSSVIGSAILGVVLNLVIHTTSLGETAGEENINAILIICVILSPFVEELMFRGVLLKMFGSACGIFGAIFITSVLFAISHGGIVQIVYTFILGIILGVVRVKSTSLWSSVVLHLSFNITGAVMMMCDTGFAKENAAIFILIGVASLFAACSGGRKLLKEAK